MKHQGPLLLVQDIKQLEGTTYVEFLPGTYKDTCWNENSAFIDTEHPHYHLLEYIFTKSLKGFFPFGIKTYKKDEWITLLETLEKSEKIPAPFIDDFSNWIKNTLKNHDEITYMGL